MNWIAYTHRLSKKCYAPSISIDTYRFADKESATQWLEEQVAKYGNLILRKKVIENEAI